MIQCLICFETPIENPVICEKDKCVYCEECFNKLIDNQIDCIKCKHIFTQEFLRLTLKEEIYNLYKEKLTEKKTVEKERKISFVDTQIKYIIDDILTMKCPVCKTAFLDFDGCLSVKCRSCKYSFCGTGCGYFNIEDTHSHLNTCVYTKGEQFMSLEDITIIQNKIKKINLTEFLKRFDEADKMEIVEKLKSSGVYDYDKYDDKEAIEEKNEYTDIGGYNDEQIGRRFPVEPVIQRYRNLYRDLAAIAIGTNAGYQKPREQRNRTGFLSWLF